MKENKELLEATIKDLDEKFIHIQNELSQKQKELQNINKPKVDKDVMEIIYDQIMTSINDYTYSLDPDDFEVELEMDSYNTVKVSNISGSGYGNLFDSIKEAIEDKIHSVNCDVISEN
tara:strand:+ start:28 stop:381 length:354 start_codon:yes stop_codon:yes gene_type:complete